MRLRALRKLEEMEIKGEHKDLVGREEGRCNACSPPTSKQWDNDRRRRCKELKKLYGPKTALGQRRTEVGDAPSADDHPAGSA